MTFNPTPPQLSLIVEYEAGHMPPPAIAKALNIPIDDFLAWLQRLAAGRRIRICQPKPEATPRPSQPSPTIDEVAEYVGIATAEIFRAHLPPDDAGS